MKRKIKIDGGWLECNLKEKEGILTIRRKIILPTRKMRSVVVEVPQSAIYKLLSFLEDIHYENEGKS